MATALAFLALAVIAYMVFRPRPGNHSVHIEAAFSKSQGEVLKAVESGVAAGAEEALKLKLLTPSAPSGERESK